jgi:uncharacterized protein YdhG (YjbR/CyaY superfamily)
MDAMRREPNPIDAYLQKVRPDHRAALQRLRKSIQAAVPEAEECITYRLPAFRLDGRILVAFGARTSHCALYPMSSLTVAAHPSELAGFDTSEGTIRFQPDHPLPAALVRKLLKHRMAENAARRRSSARASLATRPSSTTSRPR